METETLQMVVLSWPSSRRILVQNGRSHKRSHPERPVHPRRPTISELEIYIRRPMRSCVPLRILASSRPRPHARGRLTCARSHGSASPLLPSSC
eukprot:366397-Chlamydomonas_euryale.AAC.2